MTIKKIRTVADLVEDMPARAAERAARNVWKHDRATNELVFQHYRVDLDRCKTARGTLDWIVQVSHKTWATADVLADLVRALDAHLDLQGTQCGGGMASGQ